MTEASQQTMVELRERVDALVLPLVLSVFLALYVANLVMGAPAEIALLRSGGAGVMLAVIARIAIKVLEAEPKAESTEDGADAEGADLTITDAPADSSAETQNPANELGAPPTEHRLAEGSQAPAGR